MRRNLIMVVLIMLLIGCAPKISDDIAFRVRVLYEHSLLMEELSKPQTLAAIGFDATKLKGTDDPFQMIEQMEECFGMRLAGPYERRIGQLEDKMDLMMERWAELEREA